VEKKELAGAKEVRRAGQLVERGKTGANRRNSFTTSKSRNARTCAKNEEKKKRGVDGAGKTSKAEI